MERRSFYNEILTEHNLRPEFKHDLPDANITMEGVNPSCGDHIWLCLLYTSTRGWMAISASRSSRTSWPAQ